MRELEAKAITVGACMGHYTSHSGDDCLPSVEFNQ